MFFNKGELEFLGMSMEAEYDATKDMAEDAEGEDKIKLSSQVAVESRILDRIRQARKDIKDLKLVEVDAETMGHYLNVIADSHTNLNAFLAERVAYYEGSNEHISETEVMGFVDAGYLLGNVEGRLLGGRTTADDLDLIQEWEDALTGIPSKRVVNLTIYGHMEESDLADIMETIHQDIDTLGYESEIMEEAK